MRTLLIGIGAQRAGTTWLDAYFDAHPSVGTPSIKELHYFDAKYRSDLCGHFDENFRNNLESLLTHGGHLEIIAAVRSRIAMIDDESEYLRFMTKLSRGKPVACEITPSYSLLNQDGFERMSTIHNDVRLIFLLRNPIDRLWSSLKYRGKLREESVPEEEFLSALSDERFRLRSDYGRTLDALLPVFKEEKIHIEFYEHLFTDEAIKKICKFAHVPYLQANFKFQKNLSHAQGFPQDFREKAYKAYSAIYEDAAGRFGDQLPASWQQDMKTFA